MAYGYRNGMDVESDAFKPAMAYGYRNGMDVESDAFNPASAHGYRNGMDVASDAYNGSRRPIASNTRGQSQGGQAGAWSRRTGEGGPVWHSGGSPGRNAPAPLSGMQRAKAHALGVYDAGAGAVEGSGYSFGVVGTPESRAAWAQQAAKDGVEGIRRLINDPSGTVSGWWDNLTGDDPEAIRQATAQGAGVAMGVGGGVVLGRLQGTPLGRAGKVGSAADALSGLSSNQLAALRNAGLGDAEIALQIQTLGDVQLFRGTTPGFPGNPVLQQLGITPASTDPLVATVFALEGKAIGGNAVVLAGGMRKFAAGDIDLGNVRASLEREVQVNMQPSQFEAMAPNAIPVDTARQVLSDMGVAKLPPTITSSQQATQILEATSRLTPAQIQEFLVRAGIRH